MLARFKTFGRSRRIIVQSKKKKKWKSVALNMSPLVWQIKTYLWKERDCLFSLVSRMSLFCSSGFLTNQDSIVAPVSRLELPPEAPVSAIQLQLPLTHFTFPWMAAGCFRIKWRTAQSSTSSRTIMGGDCPKYYELLYFSGKQSRKKNI